MIVKLKRRSTRYRDLAVGQRYVVIGIEAVELRILNDHGRPYLYPCGLFQIVDLRVPDDWIQEAGDEGEQYAYPKSLKTPGFFEDFFDNNPKAVATFWRCVNRRLAQAS